MARARARGYRPRRRLMPVADLDFSNSEKTLPELAPLWDRVLGSRDLEGHRFSLWEAFSVVSQKWSFPTALLFFSLRLFLGPVPFLFHEPG